MSKERIIFLGTPELASFCLSGLVDNGFNIVAVITKEDKVRSRNNKIEESPVAIKAKELNIPVFKPHKIKDIYQEIKELNPDLLLTFAYGQIIPDEILALSKYKPLNLHGSLLPKYRGASPMQTCIYNGDKETGVTLMEMVHEMDAGDIYAYESFKIEDDDNYSSITEKIAYCGLQVATKYLPLYFSNELKPVKQDIEKVTFTHRITKEDEHLSLEKGTFDFINQVRSLSFTPGGYLLFNDMNIKIYKASYYSSKIEDEVGKIILAKKKLIILQLKDGQVNLDLLQRPGKKMMSSIDFNNGVKDFEGAILK